MTPGNTRSAISPRSSRCHADRLPDAEPARSPIAYDFAPGFDPIVAAQATELCQSAQWRGPRLVGLELMCAVSKVNRRAVDVQ